MTPRIPKVKSEETMDQPDPKCPSAASHDLRHGAVGEQQLLLLAPVEKDGVYPMFIPCLSHRMGPQDSEVAL